MIAALWLWLSTPQALAGGIWLLGIVLIIQTLYVAVRDAARTLRARRAGRVRNRAAVA